MDRVESWNVRGVNSINKQAEVKQFLQPQNVKLMELLETKIKASSLGALYLNLCPGWCITTNNTHYKGGRIVVIWQPTAYTVSIIMSTNQLIQCKVTAVNKREELWCTFVYAFNDKKDRETLCTATGYCR